jgi:hypothetical protein
MDLAYPEASVVTGQAFHPAAEKRIVSYERLGVMLRPPTRRSAPASKGGI